MTYVETEENRRANAVPEDPNRERAISILRRRLQTDFKSNEAFQNFLNGEAGLRRAIDNDFDRVSIVKIQEWGARITKATTEQGSRLDELRRHFMGTYLGDLFIEQLAEHGAKENGWDAQWTARCDKCRTFQRKYQGLYNPGNAAQREKVYKRESVWERAIKTWTLWNDY